MPVIVVGADTASGRRIVERLVSPDREVRAFVTDAGAAESLRGLGVKVALGDVSDDSHVAGACLNCFSAVLVTEAAADARQRSFAATVESVLAGWGRAVQSASVRRVIWVAGDDPIPEVSVAEVATVDRRRPDLAEAVYALDQAASI
ncbi:MAG: NAD-binding protein [Acidimicrobiia bacterium]|nr:hypothetical protein [Acidimicrobiia bacterium]